MVGDQLDILFDAEGQKYVRFSGGDSAYPLESNYTFEVHGTWLQAMKIDGKYVAWPIEL